MTLSKSPGFSNTSLENLTKVLLSPSSSMHSSYSRGRRKWIRVTLYRIDTPVWSYVEDMILSGFSNISNKNTGDIALGSPFGTGHNTPVQDIEEMLTFFGGTDCSRMDLSNSPTV